MTKRNYKEGQNRHLALLFPPSLDEYVAEGNPVRAIDAYVETLDLAALGFRNRSPGLTATAVELSLHHSFGLIDLPFVDGLL